MSTMHKKLALLLLLLISWEFILFWPASFDMCDVSTESLVHFCGQKVCRLFSDTGCTIIILFSSSTPRLLLSRSQAFQQMIFFDCSRCFTCFFLCCEHKSPPPYGVSFNECRFFISLCSEIRYHCIVYYCFYVYYCF